MKIVLLGGGTGGHFYPLIAVAEAIEDICTERTLIEPQLFYIGPSPFDAPALLEHDITYVPSPAGRVRRYVSIYNVFDIFKTAWGVVLSTMQLFRLYPDVIFSTGGFAAFPTLFAARLLRIPILIYDADVAPGRVSLWSSSFARLIAIAHAEAVARYPARVRSRIARVGHPIRKEIAGVAKEGAHEFLKLDPAIPTIFFTGGSQGARALNEALLDALPELVARYNVILQAGAANVQDEERVSSVVLKDSPYKERYRAFGLLNTLALKMCAGAADLIVSRAGSGSIYEIAAWGIPAILVPIPPDISHDQTENAYSYARAGAAAVLEQRNLTPHLLIAEINRIMQDAQLRERMKDAAHSFATPDAARKIAAALLEITLEHEPV